MATSTYLSNSVVEIGPSSVSVTDITDQVTAVTVNFVVEALEDTAFGSTARTNTGGLQNNSASITLYASYASSESCHSGPSKSSPARLVASPLRLIRLPRSYSSFADRRACRRNGFAVAPDSPGALRPTAAHGPRHRSRRSVGRPRRTARLACR